MFVAPNSADVQIWRTPPCPKNARTGTSLTADVFYGQPHSYVSWENFDTYSHPHYSSTDWNIYFICLLIFKIIFIAIRDKLVWVVRGEQNLPKYFFICSNDWFSWQISRWQFCFRANLFCLFYSIFILLSRESADGAIFWTNPLSLRRYFGRIRSHWEDILDESAEKIFWTNPLPLRRCRFPSFPVAALTSTQLIFCLFKATK